MTLSALSVDRIDGVIQHYLSCGDSPLLSPQQMLARERLLSVSHITASLPPLVVGAELDEAVSSGEHWARLTALHAHEPFVVSVREDAVHLLLRQDCDKDGLLRGLLRAHLCRRRVGMAASPGAEGSSVSEEAAAALQARSRRAGASADEPSLETDFSSRMRASEWVVEELLLEGRYARLSTRR